MENRPGDEWPQGMDANAYSHYYYSTYYPEYYAQLKAAASSPSTPAASAPLVPSVGPALGSRVASDKAFRQMSHYFDYESYNNTINQELKDGKRVPLKLTRQEINVLKQRKMQRKKKRMLDWLNND